MQNIILNEVDNVSKSLLETFKRFPLATLSILVVTIIGLLLIEFGKGAVHTIYLDIFYKVGFVSTLGILLFPALHLLKPHFLLSLLGGLILIAYFWFLPNNIVDAPQMIITRHLIFIVSLFIMLFWAPFWSFAISNLNFWEWSLQILFALFGGIVLSILLYLGFATGFNIVAHLFDIDIASKHYLALAFFLFVFIGSIFFISHIPKYIMLLQKRTYTKIETVFTKHLLPTFTFIYFLIMVAYLFTVTLTLELPHGKIAWLLLGFAGLFLLTHLFLTTLKKEYSIVSQTFVWSILGFIALLLLSDILFRIANYGFTQNRYYIMLIALWLFSMSIYFSFLPKAQYKWLFIWLSFILVLSQFGPWSATKLELRSQNHRIQELQSHHPKEAKAINEYLQREQGQK